MLRCSSGTLSFAITPSGRSIHNLQSERCSLSIVNCESSIVNGQLPRAPHCLAQKLEDLDVPFRIRERFPPRVEPVTSQQERVCAGVFVKQCADALRQSWHVLIV